MRVHAHQTVTALDENDGRTAETRVNEKEHPGGVVVQLSAVRVLILARIDPASEQTTQANLPC